MMMMIWTKKKLSILDKPEPKNKIKPKPKKQNDKEELN